MKSGKRAICAGPGNPPVLVDGTGGPRQGRPRHHPGRRLRQQSPLHRREAGLRARAHGRRASSRPREGRRACSSTAPQLDRLTGAAFTTAKDAGGCSHPVLNRALVGKDAAVLAREAGATRARRARRCSSPRPSCDHPFVMEEQMMPMLPVVRVKSVEEGIAARRPLRARLQALRDHPLAQRRPHDADGPRARHHAVRQERPVRPPASAWAAKATSATRSRRPPARASPTRRPSRGRAAA